MIQRITPSKISGTVAAAPSKSVAHRLLICAALADQPTEVECQSISKDIAATKACLRAIQHSGRLPCGESGSTLRFLLPVAAALGVEAEFHMEGRLPQRPMAELEQQLAAHGAVITRPQPHILKCTGKLTPGDYVLPGNVSSQYISGLLFALPLLDEPSTLTVTGTIESSSYIQMTLDALRQFGIRVMIKDNHYTIPACGYRSPGKAVVEGDWSNAAFWLCAGALGKPVTVTGLNPHSLQGDKAVISLLTAFGAQVLQHGDTVTVSPAPLRALEIDASDIPDLVPVLSVVAAAAAGTTRIFNAGRLRLKESDRISSVCGMLNALGGCAEETADGLLIHGGRPLTGGTVDSCNDHRIAMAAAVASILCENEVTIHGAEAVEKSDPDFWKDFCQLTSTGATCPP